MKLVTEGINQIFLTCVANLEDNNWIPFTFL